MMPAPSNEVAALDEGILRRREVVIWTYVKPVDRFIPARNADTGQRSVGMLIDLEAGKPTQDSIECIVSQSPDLSPQTKC
jgi:hypothetical protein